MAFAFRAVSTQGNASGGALTVTKPTGVVDGDWLIVQGYLETDTNSWSSVGAGFTLVPGASHVNAGIFRQDVWIKKASGEPASWTWTPTTSAWREVTVLAYSGGLGTGTQLDASSVNSGNGIDTAQTAPSVTTTAANDLLVYLQASTQGGIATGMQGAATTLRSTVAGQNVADTLAIAQGATGTSNATGQGTLDFVASHVALLLNSGGDTYPAPYQPMPHPAYRM